MFDFDRSLAEKDSDEHTLNMLDPALLSEVSFIVHLLRVIFPDRCSGDLKDSLRNAP